MYVVCDLLRCVLSFSRVLKWFPQGACMRAKSLQLCLTLWIPVDCSSPGSSVQGILQVRILEWVALPSSRGSLWPRDWTRVSYVSLENSMHRRACWMTVHGVAKNRTQLNDFHFTKWFPESSREHKTPPWGIFIPAWLFYQAHSHHC